MQTKKKVSLRNAREHANPRVSRLQKKASENMQVSEKKVAELITSSARKQKCGVIAPQNTREAITVKGASANYVSTVHNVCLGYDGKDDSSMNVKGCDEGTAQRILETIFSPSFHISEDVGGGSENSANFIKFFRSADETTYQGGIDGSQVDTCRTFPAIESSVSANGFGQTGQIFCSSEMDVDTSMSYDQSGVWKNGYLVPLPEMKTMNSNEEMAEVSAIYLAMQQSKLECVDELNPASVSTDMHVEADDIEEIDYFDPYLFIKNLPHLSSVVPTYRPMLLPKQTRSCPRTTLVLDLDETLVHSTLEPCDSADFTFPVNFNFMKHTVYVRCRPHLMDFMERVASLFEIIIFTASQSIYAEKLLNVLDPKRRIFRHRVYRDSCVFVEGNYLKDLSILGRDLAHVIIIDNSPQAFGFQVDNGIPIESWFDDRSDKELLLLLPFLETLVGVEDVRPLIAKKFNLQEKIDAAVYPF